jgi:hypothetical protein
VHRLRVNDKRVDEQGQRIRLYFQDSSRVFAQDQGHRGVGMEFDPSRNARGGEVISANKSCVSIRIIATDEEMVIARIVCSKLGHFSFSHLKSTLSWFAELAFVRFGCRNGLPRKRAENFP